MSSNIKKYIDLFIEFLNSECNASKNTVVSYVLDLENFSKYITKDAEDVIEEDIDTYMKCIAQSFKTSTIKRHLSSLNQFFKFLLREDIISKNPMEFCKNPKKQRTLPKTITEETVLKLQNATELLELKDRARANLILYLLYGSGLRVSELITLTKTSFVSEKFLKIFGKGHKERIVPIASATNSALKEWLNICDQSVWIFPSKNVEKHITRQRIFQILKELATLSNIDASKISPHILRHAFATHILDHGADLLSVKKMLGHKTITTTEIYTYVSTKRLKDTINDCHPLANKLDNGNTCKETQKQTKDHDKS